MDSIVEDGNEVTFAGCVFLQLFSTASRMLRARDGLLLSCSLFFSAFFAVSLACGDSPNVFACEFGAVLVTRGLKEDAGCAITVEPIPTCDPPNCTVFDVGTSVQLLKNTVPAASCIPLVAASRRCVAWCRSADGGIERGTFVCRSTFAGDNQCGGSCDQPCANFNP